MASFYAQRDYISKNLCVNRFDTTPVCRGRCYLTKQLKESEKKEQDLPEIKQEEIQLFIQSNISFECRKIIFRDTLSIVFYEDNFPVSEFLFEVFHPPKVA